MSLSATKRIRAARTAMLTALAGTGLAAAHVAAAQQGEDLSIDVTSCVELESDLERFACYESQVEAARRAGDATTDRGPAAAAAEEPEPAAAARRAEPEPEAPSAAREAAAVEDVDVSARPEPGDRFGFRNLREEAAEDDAPELVATIAALRETVPNAYLITLENGQIWRQSRPHRYPLQVGYEVRIYPSRWGSSYRLTSDILNGFIQVERVR